MRGDQDSFINALSSYEGDGLWWDRFTHSYVSKYRACTPKEECEKLEQGYFSFAMSLSFKGTWSVVIEIYCFKLGNLIKLWTSRTSFVYFLSDVKIEKIKTCI